MSFWKDKRVLVAGGRGFVGSHLVERLVRSGAIVRVPLHREEPVTNLESCIGKIELVHADLLEMDDCRRVSHGMEVVFNLAAKVGGIGYNVAHDAQAFTVNSLLNLTLLEAARLENVGRYECTSSTCVYSREMSSNASEEDAFLGDPEPTVLGYGWAKRLAETQARFYAKEYGIRIAIVRPSNAYGPRDDFSETTSHVIAALIRRVFESDDSLTVWGSGKQTRSFIYVEDVARGIMDATEEYAIADPINLGTDEEISIGDLAGLIVRLSGRELRIRFETNKPEGQPRKYPNCSKARRTIGWAPEFSLEEGLKRTIRWYKQNQERPIL